MSRAARRSLRAGLAALLILAAGAPAAHADREIPPDSLKLEVLDRDGNSDVRAGIHPDRFITRVVPTPNEDGEIEPARSLEIDFPPGMGGDPQAVPACPRETFDAISEAKCPPETQVGVQHLIRGAADEAVPIYNLEPAPGELASFGLTQFFFRTKFSGRLRSDDLGLTMVLEGLPEKTPVGPVSETIFEFWGVPADHQEGTLTTRRGFLTTPTRCDGSPLSVTVHVRTWRHFDEPLRGLASTASPLVGCQSLPYAPTVGLELDNPVASSPTGLGLSTNFPESSDPDALASSQTRSTRIELPSGMAFSPGALGGAAVCTDAQLARGTDSAASCPPASKLGTVEVGTPQQSTPLAGKIYLGEEHPNDRFRLFVVARSGTTEVKLVGSMRPDPVTGRVTTILDDLPQASFSYLRMHFAGGPQAVFDTPEECGQATVKATSIPYSGTAAVSSFASVGIAPLPGRRCGAPAPFEPGLSVTTSSSRAGAPTSFAAVISRRNGEQLTDRFRITFPSGLSAGLGSTAVCPPANIEANTCPSSSRIGGAFVGVGGAELSGTAYLTGPYRRAPFGTALIFNASIGPFNLGSFGIRAAMEIDPLTGRVSIQSDSLPRAFDGIPIRFQTIGLEIDQPGFMTNPTSCTPKRVEATMVSTENAVARPSGEFSTRGCVGLPFRPTFAIALSDRSELHRHGKPGMTITVRSRPGEANMRSIGLSLPRALKLNPTGLREICARGEALKGNCPEGARIGTGFGRTPLLGKLMQGPIFVVQPSGDGEAEIWVDLKGGGVEFNLHSLSKVKDGRPTSVFQNLPDVPLAAFTLHFAGGNRGALSLNRRLCDGGKALGLSASASFLGQNDASRSLRVPVTTPVSCRAG